MVCKSFVENIYIFMVYFLVSWLRVCLSAEGAKNVSWPWLSPLRGWGSLTMTSTDKFVYIYIYICMYIKIKYTYIYITQINR